MLGAVRGVELESSLSPPNNGLVSFEPGHPQDNGVMSQFRHLEGNQLYVVPSFHDAAALVYNHPRYALSSIDNFKAGWLGFAGKGEIVGLHEIVVNEGFARPGVNHGGGGVGFGFGGR